MQNPPAHLVMLASPGMGHVLPVLEFAKRIAALHGCHITLLVLESDAPSAKSNLLKTAPELEGSVRVLPLPSPDVSGLVGPDTHVAIRLMVMMREAVPAVRSKISVMEPKPAALVVDVFGTESLPVADDFEMLKYVLIASNARFVAVSTYYSMADRSVQEEHAHAKKPLPIPGCEPVRYEDSMDAYQVGSGLLCREFVRLGLEMPTADGILVNTWEVLESNTLKALRDDKVLRRFARAPIYPIGPLSQPVARETSNNSVLDWLDTQPVGSVIYVSFGSGGTLSKRQLVELAWGLELSRQRFIWVVRPPPATDGDSSSAFFSVACKRPGESFGAGEDSGDGTPSYLPEGFVSRTRDRGLLVPMWAPQAEILAHAAVGGFLSHGGWNSTMEALVNGVPMIVWPLYAEQMMNAAMMEEEIGIAVRPKSWDAEGVISREEIQGMVKKIMVDEGGRGIRDRVKELKQSSEKALCRKTGSSSESMLKMVRECEMNVQRLANRARGA